MAEEIVLGEMALRGSEVRSATVKAHGETRVLGVDGKASLCRLHEDPSVAFLVVRTLSQRARELSAEVVRSGAESGKQEAGS
jgi:CRP-like cAMP-binding protein